MTQLCKLETQVAEAADDARHRSVTSQGSRPSTRHGHPPIASSSEEASDPATCSSSCSSPECSSQPNLHHQRPRRLSQRSPSYPSYLLTPDLENSSNISRLRFKFFDFPQSPSEERFPDILDISSANQFPDRSRSFSDGPNSPQVNPDLERSTITAGTGFAPVVNGEDLDPFFNTVSVPVSQIYQGRQMGQKKVKKRRRSGTGWHDKSKTNYQRVSHQKAQVSSQRDHHGQTSDINPDGNCHNEAIGADKKNQEPVNNIGIPINNKPPDQIGKKGSSICMDKYIDWYIADAAYRAAVPDLDP